MTEYQIQPPTLRCAQTGRELQPGDGYYTVLRESPEGFVRVDYSVEAWAGPPPDAIAFWRARVPAASESQRPQRVDDSVVLDLFHQLAAETQPGKLRFRYILALLLLRRKMLKLVDSVRESGQEILVLHEVSAARDHRVVDPGLSGEEVAALQAEVDQMLRSATSANGN